MRQVLRAGDDIQQVRQTGARKFMQVLAARVHANDEMAGRTFSVAQGKFAVTRSQVQDDAVIVCQAPSRSSGAGFLRIRGGGT